MKFNIREVLGLCKSPIWNMELKARMGEGVKKSRGGDATPARIMLHEDRLERV